MLFSEMIKMKKYQIMKELSSCGLVSRRILIDISNHIETNHKRNSKSNEEKLNDLTEYVESDDQLMVGQL